MSVKEMAKEAESDFRSAHNTNGIVGALTSAGVFAGAGIALANPVMAPVGLATAYGSFAAGALAGHFTGQDMRVADERMAAAFDGEVDVVALREAGVAPTDTPNVANKNPQLAV